MVGPACADLWQLCHYGCLCLPMQVMGRALQKTRVNFENHIASHVIPKTRTWLRERLFQRRQELDAQHAQGQGQQPWQWAVQAVLLAQRPWYSRVAREVHGSLLVTVLRACTREDAVPLADMLAALPAHARLRQAAPLPPAELQYWQGVVDEVRGSIGPLPVTDARIRSEPCRYLPWLRR